MPPCLAPTIGRTWDTRRRVTSALQGPAVLRVAGAIRKVKPRMKPEIRVVDSRPLPGFAGTIDFLASVGVALDVDPVRIIA